ncbi:Glutathione peroxidase [Pseudoloma neurophilia]|uniref:Glutathione peroxidase n=1 Tax=Pseudoloma neurophilia TaxID=146866 RepID=A0A0R0LW59_9MICR|nr:Glutathione peroxidase [Pseudoloma neurophilia]
MRQVSADFYSLSAELPDGSIYKFSQLKEHPVLIINTATKCNLAKTTFKNIKALAKTYKKLRILIFPCGQFLNQEETDEKHVTEKTIKALKALYEDKHHEELPDNEELPGAKDLKNNEEQSFQHKTDKLKDEKTEKEGKIPSNIIIFKKIKVFGSEQHPVFTFLTKHLQGTLFNTVKWNFTKFLIDENGIPSKRYGPSEPVTIDDELIKNMFSDAVIKDEL